jgi:hypothetical protein
MSCFGLLVLAFAPRLARARKDLEQLAADTVWREIAHYFEMDEVLVRRPERRRVR